MRSCPAIRQVPVAAAAHLGREWNWLFLFTGGAKLLSGVDRIADQIFGDRQTERGDEFFQSSGKKSNPGLRETFDIVLDQRVYGRLGNAVAGHDPLLVRRDQNLH